MKSLINILSETVIAATLNEAIEDINNPLETQQPNPKNQPPPNHYIDEEPDAGWKEFWLDFNGDDEWQNLPYNVKVGYSLADKENVEDKKYDGRMSLSEEEFEAKYGKSKEDFKVDLRQEILKAKNKAVDYYINYYSPDNETVVNKITKQLFGKVRDFYKAVARDVLRKIQKRLMTIKLLGTKSLIHFSKKDVKKVGGESPDAWGWVWSSVTGPDVYNMNVYNFVRPGLGSWKEKIYSTTIHELGHVVENLLDELGVEAYQTMEDQDIEFQDEDYNIARQRLEKTTFTIDSWKELSRKKKEAIAKSLDLDLKLIGTVLSHMNWEKYLQKDTESYARLQQLRRVFGFNQYTDDPSVKEWVNMWMEKVNNGEITIGNDEQIGSQLYIPKYGLTKAQKNDKWGWSYTCKVQTFLLNQGYSVGSKYKKNGKEVCDGAYGSATKKALRDFYRNMWSISTSGTRIFITIPNEMVKWLLGVEKPRSYDEINDLTRKIYFNGEKKGDITTLLAKTAWDSGESKSKDAQNYELVLDFNEIAYYNEVFVDAEEEIRDDNRFYDTDLT